MKHLRGFKELFESSQELTQEQKDWLDKCTTRTWKVNPQTGLVDVEGSFYCMRQGLTDFKGVRFGQVSGYFICSNNELTSLEGAPQSVIGYFSCSNNGLTSLEGAPQMVGGSFYCSGNPISERAIRGVVKRMGDKKISLEQAVAEYWRYVPQEDRVYLAKHHPTLPEDEKRGYEAMGRLKGRVI